MCFYFFLLALFPAISFEQSSQTQDLVWAGSPRLQEKWLEQKMQKRNLELVSF